MNEEAENVDETFVRGGKSVGGEEEKSDRGKKRWKGKREEEMEGEEGKNDGAKEGKIAEREKGNIIGGTVEKAIEGRGEEETSDGGRGKKAATEGGFFCQSS